MVNREVLGSNPRLVFFGSTNVCEGFVIRNTDQFSYRDFRHNVAKYVRSNHVETSQHWLRKKLELNGLKNED